jgi:hypothetical protein
LAGLWAADYGPLGLQLLCLRYDFRGRAAQLRATKLTGDECVPAGNVSWHCAAASLPMPWGLADQELVEEQEARWAAEVAWREDGEEEGEGQDEEERLDGDGGSGAAAVRQQPRRRPPRVVAIHEGSGQVAAPAFQHWVSGRLLVFADGGLCFCWGEGVELVADMRRLRLAS